MKINNSSICPVLAGVCLLISSNGQAIGPPVSADESATPPAKSKDEKSKNEPLAVSFSLAQNVSGLGRVVAFSLTVKNVSNEEQTLLFNSGQNFEITATPLKANEKAKEALWRWSGDKLFAQSLRRETLQPGASKTWTAIWQGDDNIGNPAPRGPYLLEATITANGGLKAPPITLDVRAEGIREMTPRKNDLDAGLIAKLESDKSTYGRDDSAQFTLTLKNESGQTTALTYPSGQQYDFAARPAPKGKFDPKQKVIWQWSRGRAFTMMLQMKQFAPGETLTFKDKWDFKDQNGKPFPPGQYAIQGFVSANRGIPAPPIIIEVK